MVAKFKPVEKASRWEIQYTTALDTALDPYLYAQRPVEGIVHGALKLQLACLEDACRVIVRGGYKDEPRQFERDVRWVTGQTPSAPGFSFEEICESHGLDPSAWRARLVALAQAARERPATQRLRPITRVRVKRRKAA